MPRTPSGVATRRLVSVAALLTMVPGCGIVGSDPAMPPTQSQAGAPATGAASKPPTLPETDDVETVDTLTVPVAAGPTAADVEAGLRSLTVVQTGSGRLVIVPGSAPAPGKGRIVTVRVEVESGIGVDGARFAAFVMATLNDSRSWGHGGGLRFARTAGTAQIRVVLASPTTSARLCRPLQTFGKLSCRTGSAAVLTAYRWVKAIPEYGTDRTGYRHYVINHEVGHALGHGHLMCAGKGAVAPVMMQQTKGLKGCLPNPWPFPSRSAAPAAPVA